MHKVTFIPGDGTGPEVAWAMRRCVDATGVAIEWEEQHAGVDVMEEIEEGVRRLGEALTAR